MTQKINTALDAVEADIVILYEDTSLAQAWASNNQGDLPVATGTYYSARAYALECADWAVATDGSIHLANGTIETHISAKSAAEDAAADLVLTNADVVLTHADVVLTGVDVGLTGVDVVTTGDNVTLSYKWAQEAENIEVAIGEYSSYHYSLKSEDWSIASAGYAADSLTHSLKAYDWAEEAAGVEVEPGEYSAYHYALAAAASAGSIVQTSKLNELINANFAVNTREAVNGSTTDYHDYCRDMWESESNLTYATVTGEEVELEGSYGFVQKNTEFFSNVVTGDDLVISVEVTAGTTLDVVIKPGNETYSFAANPGVIQTATHTATTGDYGIVVKPQASTVTFKSLKIEKDAYTPYKKEAFTENQLRCFPYLVDQGFTEENTTVVLKDNDEYGLGGVPQAENRIINGNFNIWQRGTDQNSSGIDSDDRWDNYFVNIGAGSVFHQKVTNIASNGLPEYCREYSRTTITSFDETGEVVLKSQKIKDPSLFFGKRVHLSFWCRFTLGTQVEVYIKSIVGTTHTEQIKEIIDVTSSFQKYTLSFDYDEWDGTSLLDLNYTNVQFTLSDEAGTLGAQQGTFDLADVQVYTSDVPCETRLRTQEEELQLCLPYFQKSWNLGTSVGYTTNVGTISENATRTTSSFGEGFRFPVEALYTPAVTLYSPLSGLKGFVDNAGIDKAATVTSSHIGTKGILRVSIPTGTVAALYYHFTVESEL